ncbi:Rv2175c family DNA-binding protein [Rhodococcus sp. TAF43]|uniref:Rv2175c family DNA-binding protein n=1 Tax=unclassified Rhodococcus (in: high G+C Gram-positive bacteria) TaxID=192944 RepID=UPI00158310DE|nr:Rv2175c family DNA-binding protein [Rhodococcus sp. W8901]QKT12053.1 DNA-binding protein [Rhodococcus sp. W8901]
MSAIPYCDDVLDRSISLLQLADVSKQMGLVVTHVHQLLRDHELIAVRRDSVLGVPEAFFGDDGQPVRLLPGLIRVLKDGGYEDEEVMRWLFAEDDSLPGTPIDAMHGDLAREVVRRAQSMAF